MYIILKDFSFSQKYELTKPPHPRSEQLQILGLLHVEEDERPHGPHEGQQCDPVGVQSRIPAVFRRRRVEARQLIPHRRVCHVRRYWGAVE